MTSICGVIVHQPAALYPRAAKRMLVQSKHPTVGVETLQNEHFSFAGTSPLYNPISLLSDRLFGIGDVRLDNRIELSQKLGTGPTAFNDMDLIVRAYRKWGKSSVSHLKGEFAFAIWDDHDKRLFCARDHFGTKPFYYRETELGLRFAGEIGPLAADTGLAGLALDEPWIAQLIVGEIGDSSSTAYEQIKRLPPAHTLVVERNSLTVDRYWSFKDVPPVHGKIKITDVRERIEQAVERRLSSNTGAFLSGGLDSSSLACVANRLLSNRGHHHLSTISMVYDEYPHESEREYVEAVLANGTYEAHLENITEYRPISMLAHLTDVQHGPYLGPGLAMMDKAVRLGAQRGLTSLLDGHGGDELVSNYGGARVYELARAGQFARLAWESIQLSRKNNVSAVESFTGVYGNHGKGLLSKLTRRFNRRWTKGRAYYEMKNEPLLADHQRQGAWLERYKETLPLWHPRAHQDDRAYQDHLLATPLQSYSFETMTQMFRSNGVEHSAPFWDFDLVEICLQAPVEQKLRNGLSRRLLRDSMKGIVPDKVRLRKDKLDFTGHLKRGIQKDLPLLKEILGAQGCSLENFLNLDEFQTLIKDIEEDGPNSALAAQPIIRGANIATWLVNRNSENYSNQQPIEKY